MDFKLIYGSRFGKLHKGNRLRNLDSIFPLRILYDAYSSNRFCDTNRHKTHKFRAFKKDGNKLTQKSIYSSNTLVSLDLHNIVRRKTILHFF